ncbi:MAG: polysaccharide deacetylase [Lachnospiraceae bacterium]|nr:polysaccharide deacetylase [Lachnospiraceae bacterium]
MKFRSISGSLCYISLILFLLIAWGRELSHTARSNLFQTAVSNETGAFPASPLDTEPASGNTAASESTRQPELLSDYKSSFPELYAWEDAAVEVTASPQKTVYLTFDDGPSKNTGKILDILKQYEIKATFFVIGKDLSEEGIENMKRAAAEGHAIGLHTYSHDYKKIYSSVADFLSDYDLLRQELEEQLGFSPTIFRFPGGSYCSYGTDIRTELITEMTRRGYTYYDWNVSAEDAVGKVTAYSIRNNIFPRVYEVNAPVILMHDAPLNNLTAELLPEIIETLLTEGYCFETLETREPLHFGE